MSNAILILGESGTGKSTSLRNLNPKETYIITAVDKELPFRGWRKKYIQKSGGNFAISDSSAAICRLIDNISTSRPDIKNLVIDDFQYILSNEYMRRAKENGYGKFTDIGLSAYHIITKATEARRDLNIFVLAHSVKDKDGQSKLKTIGNMIDDKIVFEGRFTIVFHTIIDNTFEGENRFRFMTQNNGFLMAKSPMGMFEDASIPNDLQFAVNKINEYYEFDEHPEITNKEKQEPALEDPWDMDAKVPYEKNNQTKIGE